MKRPNKLIITPSELKFDEQSGGAWLYIPRWVVRAYRLAHEMPLMGHRILVEVNEKPRAPIKIYSKKWHRIAKQYYLENWAYKLAAEDSKNRRTDMYEVKVRCYNCGCNQKVKLKVGVEAVQADGDGIYAYSANHYCSTKLPFAKTFTANWFVCRKCGSRNLSKLVK